MLLVVICRWCEVDVCRDPGNVSNFIIAQHTALRFVDARICHVCWYVGLWPWKSRVVALTGEPLNSRSQILAPNRREITGVDCNGISCAKFISYIMGYHMLNSFHRMGYTVLNSFHMIGYHALNTFHMMWYHVLNSFLMMWYHLLN